MYTCLSCHATDSAVCTQQCRRCFLYTPRLQRTPARTIQSCTKAAAHSRPSTWKLLRDGPTWNLRARQRTTDQTAMLLPERCQGLELLPRQVIAQLRPSTHKNKHHHSRCLHAHHVFRRLRSNSSASNYSNLQTQVLAKRLLLAHLQSKPSTPGQTLKQPLRAGNQPRKQDD